MKVFSFTHGSRNAYRITGESTVLFCYYRSGYQVRWLRTANISRTARMIIGTSTSKGLAVTDAFPTIERGATVPTVSTSSSTTFQTLAAFTEMRRTTFLGSGAFVIGTNCFFAVKVLLISICPWFVDTKC